MEVQQELGIGRTSFYKMKKKIIALISGAVILIIAAGSIYGKSESGHKKGEPDVVGTFSVNRDENIAVAQKKYLNHAFLPLYKCL